MSTKTKERKYKAGEFKAMEDWLEEEIEVQPLDKRKKPKKVIRKNFLKHDLNLTGSWNDTTKIYKLTKRTPGGSSRTREYYYAGEVVEEFIKQHQNSKGTLPELITQKELILKAEKKLNALELACKYHQSRKIGLLRDIRWYENEIHKLKEGYKEAIKTKLLMGKIFIRTHEEARA